MASHWRKGNCRCLASSCGLFSFPPPLSLLNTTPPPPPPPPPPLPPLPPPTPFRLAITDTTSDHPHRHQANRIPDTPWKRPSWLSSPLTGVSNTTTNTTSTTSPHALNVNHDPDTAPPIPHPHGGNNPAANHPNQLILQRYCSSPLSPHPPPLPPMANPWYPPHPPPHHHYPSPQQPHHRGIIAHDGDPDPIIPIAPRPPRTVRPVRVIGYHPNGEPICEPLPAYDNDNDDGGSFYDEDSDDYDDDDDDGYYAEDSRRRYGNPSRSRTRGDELRIIVRSRPASDDEESERSGRSSCSRSRRPRDRDRPSYHLYPPNMNSRAASRSRSRPRSPASREEAQNMRLRSERFHRDPKDMREKEKRFSAVNQTLEVIGNQLRDIARNEYAVGVLTDGNLALGVPRAEGK
ncbi:hypothetical protein EX30DRAFT_365699 [Ascodesmis nigricans]|uniref:Uncharacterized protein n=1 Tax=Ascodesmis nigricans TaxID=341454 RepID=A0A4S2MNU7_9PEZI|nr:hypothetical protein EX30DRAFT_365699 [Ascodesmis nigricans]